MTEQVSLWKSDNQPSAFAEFCNALYERELHTLSHSDMPSIGSLQGRLKSLPYYVNRTARLMMQCSTPLVLDIQNASWSAKQVATMPLASQDEDNVKHWYASIELIHGLVVPIVHDNRIVIDCIDRVDSENSKFRTNAHGWFYFNDFCEEPSQAYRLLKPNKKVMTAACSGHCWVNQHRSMPEMPSLRELLLSCTINWKNFKKPIAL